MGFSVLAQQKIKGVVVNATTKEPIAGSSVFLNNTSIGTATDKAGQFELGGIPGGRHELIVSSIGYTTYVLAFNSTELPMDLKVELAVKMKELDNVIVEHEGQRGRDNQASNTIAKTKILHHERRSLHLEPTLRPGRRCPMQRWPDRICPRPFAVRMHGALAAD